MRSQIFSILCTLIIILIGVTISQAQVPQLINYQGYITDSEGVSINGPVSILFSIHSDSTGGTLLWSETQNVNVSEGLFSVLLGSAKPIPYSVFHDSLVYLELKVGSDPPMTPRKQLVSVGYSFHAYDSEKLGGKEDSEFVRSVDGVLPDTSGNVDLASGGNDWGRSGVADNLYEGTTKLKDKYVNQTGPEEMTGNSSNHILTVTNNGDGSGVEGKHAGGNFGILGGPSRGVYGYSSIYAVYGKHTSGNYGYLGSSYEGAQGHSDSGKGVYGHSGSGSGVYGYSINGKGVHGKSAHGWAGYFEGKVKTTGIFLVNTAGSAASPAIQLNDSNSGLFDAGRNAIGFTTAGTEKMRIIGDKVGIGRTNPSHPLHMGSGACCTAGGVWTNASSMKYKENVAALSLEKATDALEALNPVTFNYKLDASEMCVGFIAEDVPDLVATQDRDGLSPMDIVAVLTRVVQEQQKVIKKLRKDVAELKKQ